MAPFRFPANALVTFICGYNYSHYPTVSTYCSSVRVQNIPRYLLAHCWKSGKRNVWEVFTRHMYFQSLNGIVKVLHALLVMNIYNTENPRYNSVYSVLFRENDNEEAHYMLNSRIIGSLVFPPASNQKLDVHVTLQHVMVRLLLWIGNYIGAISLSYGKLFQFMKHAFMDVLFFLSFRWKIIN